MYQEIKGFEGLYEISRSGQVRSLPREIVRSNGVRQTFKRRLLAVTVDDKGYKKVSLQRKGKRVTLRIHTLLAREFMDNPKNLPMVNHIDEVKSNNDLSNLEWCTHQYNMAYSKAETLYFNKEGKDILITNLNQFCIKNDLDQGAMSRVRNSICKQHKGYYYGRA